MLNQSWGFLAIRFDQVAWLKTRGKKKKTKINPHDQLFGLLQRTLLAWVGQDTAHVVTCRFPESRELFTSEALWPLSQDVQMVLDSRMI